MSKNFIVGRTYKLKQFPICKCVYTGDWRGDGTDIYGNKGKGIVMNDIELWELVEDVPKVPVENQEFKWDVNLGNQPKIKKEPFEIPASTLVESDKGIRTFTTGANRNSDEGKLDFEGFLSPAVLEVYAEYMNRNRTLEDGSIRDSDNWQKGIPQDAYMKSMFRHFIDVWKDHRGLQTQEDEITNLCALLFNVSGMLFEKLRDKNTNE